MSSVELLKCMRMPIEYLKKSIINALYKVVLFSSKYS